MKRVFSGIQPTNILHIGNYLGAIKNWIELQDKYSCIFSVVDLHAMTVKTDPKTFGDNILMMAKTYLAFGIDPKKSLIFRQSEVPAHTELTWILNTIAKISELERMTQFKDKAKQHKENVNMGLFGYPVLMASDILLYDTNLVPVGEDQVQHIELTRTLAERFNRLYGETFVLPEPMVKKHGARIMGLDDPSKKMSKSSPNAGNYIALLDDPAVASKKIMRAVTDSGSEIKSGANKPALTNLLVIYSLLSGKDIKDIEKEYAGKGYADFKKGLAEVVSGFLSGFQKKFNVIKDSDVRDILADGEKKANEIAERKMRDVKTKIGLTF
ncbi:MAG: tryptophan--tRNA ligase [Candidatus Magasanikbacteria bacterium]|nr:tryptophan--tRNA ligase [Candidatus Magasanikbacteria bacterium]